MRRDEADPAGALRQPVFYTALGAPSSTPVSERRALFRRTRAGAPDGRSWCGPGAERRRRATVPFPSPYPAFPGGRVAPAASSARIGSAPAAATPARSHATSPRNGTRSGPYSAG